MNYILLLSWRLPPWAADPAPNNKKAAALISQNRRWGMYIGEVLDHAENTPVPALGGLAHLCRNVCDLLVHTIEHPR